MNNFRICVFGGTTEGRKFAEFLSEANINTDLFIATEYGHQFVKNLKNINIIQRRLDESEMNSLFMEKRYDYIVDATHPFAREVSENIANASNANNIKYLRIIRKSS
ncbi:MAG TPA: precorrin-6A/cobalt-precorrin-6A reductase, partial [Sedimentibacter sp.]|nr:precorrin-6A/cobalt-precorrin-6A reductase [Sedimentibacter sp.]